MEEGLSGFCKMCTKFLKIGKYFVKHVGGLYEKPVFLDMVPDKSFAKKGSKSVTVTKSGSEKRHVAVALTQAACRDILTPMIIFPGKTDNIINDLTDSENLCIATKEMAWMDERLMMVWYENIWLR